MTTQFSCTLCGEKFKQRQALVQHEQMHIKQEQAVAITTTTTDAVATTAEVTEVTEVTDAVAETIIATVVEEVEKEGQDGGAHDLDGRAITCHIMNSPIGIQQLQLQQQTAVQPTIKSHVLKSIRKVKPGKPVKLLVNDGDERNVAGVKEEAITEQVDGVSRNHPKVDKSLLSSSTSAAVSVQEVTGDMASWVKTVIVQDNPQTQAQGS